MTIAASARSLSFVYGVGWIGAQSQYFRNVPTQGDGDIPNESPQGGVLIVK